MKTKFFSRGLWRSMYNLLKLFKGGWKSHNITLKAYHTLKKQNKIPLDMPLLLGISCQHPTSHQPRQPRQPCRPRGPLGGLSPESPRLPQSALASSSFHIPTWNSGSKQRSLRLSGLLFLRSQWEALRNHLSLSYRYLYIQREKSEQLRNTLFSSGVDPGVLLFFHCILLYCWNIL